MARETLSDKIREDLAGNPSIQYWQREVTAPNLLCGDLLKPNRYTAHKAIFIVAPKKPILPDNEFALNDFMQSLTTREPVAFNSFTYGEDVIGRLTLGCMVFEEPIGRAVSAHTIHNEVFTDYPQLFEPGELSSEHQKVKRLRLYQQTVLRPYPDIRTAQWIFDFEQGVAEGKIVATGYKYHWLQSFLTASWVRQIKNERNPLKKGYNPFAPSRFRGETKPVES